MKKLTVAPLSVGDNMSAAALKAIENADKLFCQTLMHSTAEWLNSMHPVSMDDLYDNCTDFDELNSAIADRVTDFDCDSAAFAVLGGGIDHALCEKLKACAEKKDVAVQVLPGTGFAECALAESGVLFGDCTCICKATALPKEINPYIMLGIEEIGTVLRAGEIKLALTEFYPDEYEVILSRIESGEYKHARIKLMELDRQQGYGADTVLIVPPAKFEELTRHGADDLLTVLKRLRAPGGCPWDAEQTHESLKTTLVEESYEVLDAINTQDENALMEELGDLLLQIAFHAEIEEEFANFNFRDVTTGIVNKLVYRHPHVFGDVQVSGTADVLANWEVLKRNEKHQKNQSEVILAIPKSFPALVRSYKVQKKAADVGFDWSSADEAFYKIGEETAELREAMRDNSNIDEELGDLLFAVVNVARLLKRDPELCLYDAAEKFAQRFMKMESLVMADGLSLKDMNLEQMDAYWERAKRLF